MDEKQKALDKMTKLIIENNISEDEIAKIFYSKTSSPNHALTNFFVYLGSILIIIAISNYISWKELTNTLKSMIILGPAIILFLLMIAAEITNKYQIVSMPFAILASILMPIGLLIFISYPIPDLFPAKLASILVFSFMSLLELILFIKFARIALLFFTILYATLAYIQILAFYYVPYNIISLTTGLSYICLSIYFQPTLNNFITSLGFFFGSIWINLSYLTLVVNKKLEATLLLLILLQLYIGFLLKNRILIIANIIAAVIYITYYTEIHLKNSLPFLIIMFGAGIISTISGIYLNKKITK